MQGLHLTRISNPQGIASAARPTFGSPAARLELPWVCIRKTPSTTTGYSKNGAMTMGTKSPVPAASTLNVRIAFIHPLLQHFLNFLPLPHGHGSLRPIFGSRMIGFGGRYSAGASGGWRPPDNTTPRGPLVPRPPPV